MAQTLTLGYSPCPNDTFIFYALIHSKVPTSGVQFQERLEDVETLNQLALNQALDITKISYHALGHLRDNYALLRSGGALGRGCGPLIVARSDISMAQLKGRTIAIPGQLTTANLLLQLYGEGYEQVTIMPFDKIIPAVARGDVAAGVIIHESRFTYQQHGLKKVIDLGEWWETDSGCPIPLGGILVKRDLGTDQILKIDKALHQSVKYAYAHPQETRQYIKEHAQELDDQVIQSHIGLYVNEFSLDLGHEGIKAIETLFFRAEERGIIPPCDKPLFVE